MQIGRFVTDAGMWVNNVFLFFNSVFFLAFSGGHGEDGGEGKGTAGRGQAQEAVRRPQVLPEQRSAEGISGFPA